MAGEIPNREEESEPEQISPEELERQNYEKVWLESKDPSELLSMPAVNLDNRETRLFLWSCMNSISDFYPEKIIKVMEKYAENLATPEELRLVRRSLNRLSGNHEDEREVPYTIGYRFLRENFGGISVRKEEEINDVTISIARVFARDNIVPSEYFKKAHEVIVEKRTEQADLLRDVVRNPFAKEPVEFDSRWRTSDVIGLARAIYEDKAFERMPILSDALMDAGCENEEIISHCRSECEHVRGCWLLDLILQKE